MIIKKAATIVFSPCGSTEKATQYLVDKLPFEVEHHNLTLPDSRKGKFSFDGGTLVFFSFPVYGGLPLVAKEVLANIQGNDTPAVYVAVRGDTEPAGFYHSLNEILSAQGFRPVAAVAAVAEHTLMPTVSHGRPNADDARLLGEFGLKALERANAGVTLAEMPGEKKKIPDFVFNPITDSDKCISCGQCAENCPMAAISDDDYTTQDDMKCIQCSACAHVCPVDARSMGDGKAQEMLRKFATETFADLHLETKLFM